MHKYSTKNAGLVRFIDFLCFWKKLIFCSPIYKKKIIYKYSYNTGNVLK